MSEAIRAIKSICEKCPMFSEANELEDGEWYCKENERTVRIMMPTDIVNLRKCIMSVEQALANGASGKAK